MGGGVKNLGFFDYVILGWPLAWSTYIHGEESFLFWPPLAAEAFILHCTILHLTTQLLASVTSRW